MKSSPHPTMSLSQLDLSFIIKRNNLLIYINSCIFTRNVGPDFSAQFTTKEHFAQFFITENLDLYNRLQRLVPNNAD